MFGTLKYNGISGDPYRIERTKPPFHTEDVSKNQTNACKTCREKKLKCTGEKTGCRRCRTKDSQCIYLEPGESKNGHSRKASTTAVSKRLYKPNRVSLPVNVNTGGAVTSGQQRANFGQNDQRGTGPSSQLGSGPGTLSNSSEGNASPRSRQSTSASSQTLENMSGLTGDMDTEIFDFGELNGTEANNDNSPMPLGFEFDLASLRNGFDPSKLLHEDPWIDDLPNHSQSNQLDASMADWSSSLQNKPPHPFAFQIPQSARTPTRQGSPDNMFNPPSRSSTSSSNADSHSNSEFTCAPALAGQTCSCIPTALKIDEQLKVYTSSKGGRSMTGSGTVRKLDEDLHHWKQAIVRCSDMLDCKSCNGQSSVMMLVLSICEKILESIGQLSAAFLASGSSLLTSRRPSSAASSGSRYNSLSMISNSGDANMFDSTASGDEAGKGTPRKIFANAILDIEDEVSIVKVLVMARMKNLGDLLSRLEKLINFNRWSGHGNVLENIRSDYRRTAGAISNMEVQQ